MVPANRTKMADVWVPFLEPQRGEREGKRKEKEEREGKQEKGKDYSVQNTLNLVVQYIAYEQKDSENSTFLCYVQHTLIFSILFYYLTLFFSFNSGSKPLH